MTNQQSNPGTDDSQKLKGRFVGHVTNNFHVPSFQRGYRWERKQVRQLLDDILKSGNSVYYLQPIVVAPRTDNILDLIDGQQRLTTLKLIYQILSFHKKSYQDAIDKGLPIANPLAEVNVTAPYNIEYETRQKVTSSFIDKISHIKLEDLFEEARATPDTLYMWHACDEMCKWFGSDVVKFQSIAQALNTRVKIIWYQLEESVDCWEKFADLNVGKIPLTNSELIKALFMREDNKNAISEHDKSVIADQWDSIERELCNKQFWDFLTNRKMEDYDTKLDLLFDIIAGKKKDEHDDFFTFLHFEKEYENDSVSFGKKKWNEIYLQYLRLRDWYEDPTNELYHKIGYLVTVDSKDEVLGELFEYAKEKTHRELMKEIDRRIRESIALPVSKTEDGKQERVGIKNLAYKKNNALIQNILTLFNVMTTQGMADKTQRYSFYHHKNVGGGWSLEHIHAQKSDLLNKEEQWTQWIMLHRKSLKRYKDLRISAGADDSVIEAIDKLDADMVKYLDAPKRERTQNAFTGISSRFAEIAVSDDRRTGAEYKDEMANMALLSKHINSMLNNSVFDVKRGLILDAISREFIPVCTQRVFLKAYTPQDENQLFFWGKNDRDAYIDVIESTLKNYLPEGYITEAKIREQNKKKETESANIDNNE